MDNGKNEIISAKDNIFQKFAKQVSDLIDTAKAKIVKRIIVNFHSEYSAINMAKSIKNDDIKLQVIPLFEDDYNKVNVATTLNTNESKLKSINLINEYEAKEDVLSSINSDLKKLELLSSGDEKIVDIVAKQLNVFKDLTNYKGKIELLKDTMATFEQANNFNVEDILKKLQEQVQIVDEAKKLPNDNEKIEALAKIENDFLKSEVIKTIEDDGNKIKALALIKSELSRANIVSSLADDDKKIELLSSFQSDKNKSTIIDSLSNDDKKLEVISSINGEFQKALIISKLKDESKKLEALSLLKDDVLKEYAIATLTDEGKIKSLQLLKDDNSIRTVILSITDEDMQIDIALKTLNYEDLKYYMEEGGSTELSQNKKFAEVQNLLKYIDKTKKSRNDDEKLEGVKTLNNEHLKLEIINTINDDAKKAQAIYSISDEKLKIEAITTLKDDNIKLDCIRRLSHDSIIYYRRTQDIDFVKCNIDFFVENEGFKGQVSTQVLQELYEKNNSVIQTIDFRMLQPKYIELLGENKINLISCYPKIQEQFLALGEKESSLFSKCIEEYTERMQTDEWTVLAYELLENLSNGEYKELLNNIDSSQALSQEDLHTLTQVLQNTNWCKISNLDQVRNFEEIRKSKSIEIMEDSNATIEQKQNAVVQKIFGHDLKFANNIIEKFGEDIENIPDGDMKDYVRCLKLLNTIEDETILSEIFNSCEFVQTDKITIERGLKNEYGKLFNEGLYKPETMQLVDKAKNIYEAGTNFKMLVTSVGAYVEHGIDDYKKDWNRPAISSQYFCTSYIRNDMIGTAPINSICYGFSSMKDDALMLSGNNDIYSGTITFKPHAARQEKYYTPDQQINKTDNYNEMCFRRIQNGEKKQPDYIVVFRKNGKISNMKQAEKASKQWGNMPIVIVDIDKCLEAERQKLNNLMQKYKQKPTPALTKMINQKVRNNRVTDYKFAVDINDELEKMNDEYNRFEKQKEESAQNTQEIEMKREGDSSKESKMQILYRTVKQSVEEDKDER